MLLSSLVLFSSNMSFLTLFFPRFCLSNLKYCIAMLILILVFFPFLGIQIPFLNRNTSKMFISTPMCPYVILCIGQFISVWVKIWLLVMIRTHIRFTFHHGLNLFKRSHVLGLPYKNTSANSNFQTLFNCSGSWMSRERPTDFSVFILNCHISRSKETKNTE